MLYEPSLSVPVLTDQLLSPWTMVEKGIPLTSRVMESPGIPKPSMTSVVSLVRPSPVMPVSAVGSKNRP